jgi:cell wall-associated NlpC family hydrolase
MKMIKMLVSSCLMLALAGHAGFSETYQSVEITANKLNVREDMTIEAPILGTLNQEALVDTLALTDGWYKISYSGKPAYISADYTEVVENYIPGRIKGSYVNVRNMPSTENTSVVSQLSNAEIKVHSKEEDWYHITTPDGAEGYVFSDFVGFDTVEAVESVEATPVAASIDSTDILAIAKSKLGCPYVWAGEGPDSFDCSGFAKYCFKEAYGVILPHSASAISTMGTTIPKDQLQAGDFVFFTTNRSGNVNHVGIYIGNGEFIHASSSSYNGHQVHINPLNKGFYSEVYKWAKRIPVE